MAGLEIGSSSSNSRIPQRANTDDICALFMQDFKSTLNKLGQLWDEVHLDSANREGRVQQAYEFVQNLLCDIVTSEEQMIKNVFTDLEARQKAVAELSQLLNLAPFDESKYPEHSITLLKALDNEMNRLAKLREEVMGKQKSYLVKYEACCHLLGVQPDQVEGIDERVFSDEELNALHAKYTEMKNTLAKQLDKAFQLQNESKKIFDTVQLPENNSIGEEDLQCLRTDLQDPQLAISAELLEKLAMLNQRLKDHYDAWIEQVAFRYDELLVKLDELSEKCFRPPVSQDYPTNLEHLSEKDLKKLEDEVNKRQELYNRAQPIFDKLNEWMSAWKQKLDTERRVCRASFYKNRAGSLNQKLKERRALDTKVPKLYAELCQLCQEYVTTNKVYDILVEGLRADKYVENILKSYEQDRELQRAQKQVLNSAKKTPHTPLRNNVNNIFATSTPSRHAMRRLPFQPATVASTNPRKRSYSCTHQLSAILPTKSPGLGPRTSSPKPEQRQ